MLEGAPGADSRLHSKEKNERHVCVGPKEVSIPNLARLQVPNDGDHLPSTSTHGSGQPQIYTGARTDRGCKGSHSKYSSRPPWPCNYPSGTPPQEEEAEEEDDIAGAAHLA